ncbi:MAG TPA: hypothetical protein DEA50_03475 [Parvularcula sp.]|nr:hypothetical protein [Parvularcula sp.]
MSLRTVLLASTASFIAAPAMARVSLDTIRYSVSGDTMRVVFDVDAPPGAGDFNISGDDLSLSAEHLEQRAQVSAASLPPKFLMLATADETSLALHLQDGVEVVRQFELSAAAPGAPHRIVVDLVKGRSRAPSLRAGPPPQMIAALDPAEVPGVRPPIEAESGREVTSRDLGRVLGVSNDDVRPEDQLEISLFGAPLTIGGEIEAATLSQSNLDLDRGADDYRLRAAPELKFEALYLPSENFAAFVQAKSFLTSEVIDADGSDDTEGGARLDQAWVFFSEIFGLHASLQLGRQKFQDRREWWWDDDIEAARLHFSQGKLFGFIAVAEELWSADTLEPLEPADKDKRNILGNLAYQIDPKKLLELFFLNTNDHSDGYAPGELVLEDAIDDADADLTWLGLRYRGRHKISGVGKVYFNADLARVAGTETLTSFDDPEDDEIFAATAITQQKVRGWALDTSFNWELPFEFEPYLTLGYARGSADRNAADGVDRNFRQTGLHGNNGKNRGISRFRYYGEVLRPDLSNLQVLTGAVGVPVGETFWIEALYHDYRQLTPATELSAARLDADPLGVDKSIGKEIDLVVSYEYQRRWEAELTFGAFRAGEAFGPAEGEWSTAVAFKLNYNF